jgi:DNA-binding transcriptional MocR family regulator
MVIFQTLSCISDQKKSYTATKKMIEVKAKAKNVLFVPGNVFMVDDTQPCSYIRSSYSIATPEQMDLVSISFLETVKKSRQINQV